MAEGIKLILGLGNPGQIYKNTRHNVGFRVVSLFAKRKGLKFQKKMGHSRVAQNEVVLAKPYTFMNLSGKSAKALLQKLSLSSQQMLVVCDDVALPLGRIRIRKGGSDGGHNGLRSIINELGTMGFPRLRIGIGGGEINDLVEYVLGEFTPQEEEILKKVLELTCDAIECILQEGLDRAMSKFNSLVID